MRILNIGYQKSLGIERTVMCMHMHLKISTCHTLWAHAVYWIFIFRLIRHRLFLFSTCFICTFSIIWVNSGPLINLQLSYFLCAALVPKVGYHWKICFFSSPWFLIHVTRRHVIHSQVVDVSFHWAFLHVAAWVSPFCRCFPLWCLPPLQQKAIWTWDPKRNSNACSIAMLEPVTLELE